MFFGNSPRREESGQAIVLIALIVVILLGFTGLAVDGGRLFLMQRDAQNAADTASNAGAYARCTGGSLDSMTAAAENAAQIDGFANDATYPDTVVVEYPRNNNDDLVGVYVKSRAPAFFMQLINGQPMLEVTAFSSSGCHRNSLADDRAAIVALDQGGACENAFALTGSTISVDGAAKSNDEFFNSCSAANFTSCDFIGDDNRSVNTVCGNTTYPMDPVTEDELPVIDPEALCQQAGTDCTIHQGNWFVNPASCPANLEGVHLVYGDVRINCSFSSGLKGLTILSIGGTIDISTSVIARWDPYIPGLALYTSAASACTVDAVKISVKESNISGLIFAPYASCQFSASDTYFFGSLICNVVKISASNTEIRYNPDLELLLTRYVRYE